MDRIKPTCALSVEDGYAYTDSLEVGLTLPAADELSGVAWMRFRNGQEDELWSDWEAYSENTTWELLDEEGSQRVEAQVRDRAGNRSYTAWGNIILDMALPQCQILINDDASYTSSDSVTLVVEATDPAKSGVASMRFRNEPEEAGYLWSDWVPLATTHEWELISEDGTRTVYAQVRDRAGNRSNTSWDDVILDTYSPWIIVSLVDGQQGSEAYGTEEQIGFVNPRTLPSGWHSVEINASERVRDLPVLSYTIVDGNNGCELVAPLEVQREIDGGSTLFRGDFFVNSDQCYGEAGFLGTVTDLAGNVGNHIQGDSAFCVDPSISAEIGGLAWHSDGSFVEVMPGGLSEDCLVHIMTPAGDSDSVQIASNLLQGDASTECLCSEEWNTMKHVWITPVGSQIDATAAVVQWDSVFVCLPFRVQEDDCVAGLSTCATAEDLSVLGLDYNHQQWMWIRLNDGPTVIDLSDNQGMIRQRLREPGFYVLTGVVPISNKLSIQVFPCPFQARESTWLSFRNLPVSSSNSVTIYDVTGGVIRILTPGSGVWSTGSGGSMVALWDGSGVNGERVSSGVYLYVIETDRGSVKGKLAVFR